jgi:Acetyltransferase (GNAT) domain
MASDLVVHPYEAGRQVEWDAFVQRSKNGTFLFQRDYMDYHRDRFEDCSFLVLTGNEIVALFPANRSGSEIHSHQGLTYGGLVTDEAMTLPLFLDAFSALVRHLQKMSFHSFFYKTIPVIYHRLPSDEDRYALFLADGKLYRRDVLSVVAMPQVIPMQRRRYRGALKATKHGVIVQASQDWPAYWRLLTGHLRDRFGVDPVHTLSEIEHLRQCFPGAIHLHIASLAEEILAGVVIYESPRVAHVQYICSSERGRELGALDLLFVTLLNETYSSKPFFDFGISNTRDGKVLNRGLVEQKEGFGARSIAHDFYRLAL